MLNLPLMGLSGMERWQGRQYPTDGAAMDEFTMPLIYGTALLTAAAMAVYFILRKRAASAHQEEMFLSACQQKGLSQEEQDLLSLLTRSARLKRPEMIVSLEPVFEQAAQALLAGERVARMSEAGRTFMVQLLEGLRQKLGFVRQAESENDTLHTSRQISEGSSITVSYTGLPQGVGGVLKQTDPYELVIETESPIEAKPGETWLVRYTDGATIWEFDAPVVRQVDQKVYLQHSERVRFINRRSFPRVPVSRKASIASFAFDITDSPDVLPAFHPAQLVELAGFGLKMESPIELVRNQRALVILHLAPDKIVQGQAKVHRCMNLGSGKFLIVLEMVGLSSQSIADMARQANIAVVQAQMVTPPEDDKPAKGRQFNVMAASRQEGSHV